ncbi:amino acid adenylation domain-containing protein [Lentzea sp. CC55]|uniref:amino acid adenylation domain-containing protein n=1 Tax=Lentzea sp. CC55 TaxID=2884909 RepID=UPI0027E198D0|nr:amino acid adenylation domain-containing protein [Lentzea sp. CC55]MCG8927683.1 amino acid adenylation domain-containing protein [Lentzea sp. CC55]
MYLSSPDPASERVASTGPSPGVVTAVPRWPAPGPAVPVDCHREVPAPLRHRLGATADALGTTVDALLLAAHLAVLRAITAEPAPVTGLVTGAAVRAVSAQVAGRRWTELVSGATEVRGAPGGQALGGAPRGEQQVEAVLDLSPEGARHEAVLGVRFFAGALTVTSRSDLLSADAVARIAGYHLAAVRLLCADPDAVHRVEDLLDAAEIRHQLDELSGPRVPLGDRMTAQLIAEQAAREPDEVAVSHRDRSWTHGELDARSAEVAAALLERGPAVGEIVAVVTDRGLGWAAAVLGVLRAGGAYLPVDPEAPAGRIASVLDRAGCRVVLTGQGVEPGAWAAGRAVLPIDGLLGTGAHADPVPVSPGSLAYVYFTSGSTGTPKGVMCEHGGLLNHLLAKIADMELAAGEVVAQTAAQSFDISLWQLLAPLLCGGSSRIVDAEVLLDADALVEELTTGRVRVAQLVPSYFEVLLDRLERGPGGLGAVRALSVTGEVLRPDLARRWFACCPGTTLVNAYGATELSDDTTHAVLRHADEQVTLGRPVRNVEVSVLDDTKSLLPLGAPGEIAFSGVCVGRGYLDDEEQTARAFVPDPHRPGRRLYRTGDIGRWLPGGRLEFLGRRDEQIRVRGVRVEIGEIEHRLAGIDGVTSGAVVVDSGAGREPILVAFFTGSGALDGGAVRGRLSEQLPDQLVPTYVHRLDRLPLTANGKIDKVVLATVAATLGHADGPYAAPVTPTERALATAWAEVLHVPLERIGHADHFFRLGGTSLSVVRLLLRLDGLVSLRQVLAHPVLSELAAVIDEQRPTPAPPLLHQLSDVDHEPVATLVCFPHEGGNSVNFHELARELREHGVRVLAVELPGHDLDAEPGQLAEVPAIAEAVRAELRAHLGADAPLLLWGHSSGAAPALALARLLDRDGEPARRVFLGAVRPATDSELRAEDVRVAALDERDLVTAMLEDSGYIEVDGGSPRRARVVGAAYRHDVRAANRFFRDVLRDPGAHRVAAPVDIVVAADDPHTAGARERLPAWAGLSDVLTLRELPEGGHYFPSSRAAEVARIVLGACPRPTSPRSLV